MFYEQKEVNLKDEIWKNSELIKLLIMLPFDISMINYVIVKLGSSIALISSWVA